MMIMNLVLFITHQRMRMKFSLRFWYPMNEVEVAHPPDNEADVVVAQPLVLVDVVQPLCQSQ